MEFYLSLMFYHLKLDASNLSFQLIDDLEQAKLVPMLEIDNNATLKCFNLENFDFNYLITKIKPQFFVEIFICLIHERKIVIVNNDIGKNVTIMQTLLTLLFPLSWPCSMLKYLSPALADYLDVPFPFLVGISKKLCTEIYTSRWDRKDEDIVVFDLHSQTT